MSTPAEKRGFRVGDWLRFFTTNRYGIADYVEAILVCDDGTNYPFVRDKEGVRHCWCILDAEKMPTDPDYIVTPEKDSAVTDEDWPRQGPDHIHHPPHYTKGDIECIEAIEAALGREGAIAFCRGNAMKYLWRAGDKGDAETDFRKAVWYCHYAASLSEGGE